MAQTIKLKRSAQSGVSGIPSTLNLDLGEVGINTYHGKMYIKKDDGTESIVEVGDTSGYLPLSGGTLTGNLSLGDNVKATFGDAVGGDLQIYHSGTESVIHDSGTGNLDIRADSLSLLNAAGSEYYARFYTNGAANLYHNGILKINTTSTGIDVTGSVVADGLTLHKASTNADVTYAKMRMDSWGFSTGKLKSIEWSDVGNAVAAIGAEYDGSKTNIHFHSQYNGAFKGTSDKTMSIMGNGNVNIPNGGLMVGSTTSPSSLLHVNNTADSANGITIQNSSASGSADAYLQFTSSSSAVRMGIDATGTDAFKISNGTALGTNDVLVIDNQGRVGIGTVPEAWTIFDVLQIGDGGSIASVNASSKTLRLGSNQYYDGAWKRVSTGVTTSYVQYNGEHIWNSTASGTLDVAFTETERMRLSGGNLLVGTTSNSVYNDASGTGIALNAGQIQIAGTGAPLYLNRQGSDGTIAEFRKSGTTIVGSIGTIVGDGSTYLIGPNTGIGLGSTTVFPMNGSAAVSSDAAIDLGYSGGRFKDLYLSGGLRGDTTFKNNAGTTEYARFSGGNLLVGTTDDAAGAGNTVTGISLRGGTDNRSFFSVNQNYVMHLNRKGNSGNILEFAQDGSGVGSIGTQSGNFNVGRADKSIQFHQTLGVIPWNQTTNGATDNALDLGYSGARFKDLYLSGKVTAADIYNAAGGHVIDLNNTDSTIINDPDNHSCLLLSGGSYDTNYYSNDTHYFRGRDALDIHAIIDTSGIKSLGDYKVGSTTVIDSSRNATFNSVTISTGNLNIRTQNEENPTDVIYLGANNGNGAGTSNDIGTGLVFAPQYTGYTKRSAGIMQIAEGNYFRSGLAFYTNNTANATTDWSERMRLTMEGNLNLVSGSLTMGGTTVIDASRNSTFVNNSVSKLTLVAPTAGNLECYATGTGTPTTNWRISGASSNLMTLNGSGNLTISGSLTQNSDRRIKDNIAPITDALSKTCSLQGSTYTRIDEGQDKDKVHAGLIAQDVEAVLPQAVGEIDGIKTIDYSSVIALLVESIKDLKSEVDDLKTQLSLKDI